MIDPAESNLREKRRRGAAGPANLPEFAGAQISWAGLQSVEPMVRGCDQSAWFEKLAAASIRHVVVPFNGAHEDGCLFARRQQETAFITPGMPRTIYDLERRDEGAIIRLKYLLEAARSAGVMVGLSLFPDFPEALRSPLHESGNVQHVSLSLEEDARLLKPLQTVADSVSSAVRGCRGVWVEAFRGSRMRGTPLERSLSRRIADTLAKHGEDLSPLRNGPWVAAWKTGEWPEKAAGQVLPCEVYATLEKPGASVADILERADAQSGRTLAQTYFAPQPAQARLLRFAPEALPAEHFDWLWQVLFRGYWPVAAVVPGDARWTELQRALSAVARFSSQWMSRGRIRPAPDLSKDSSTSGAVGACDGVSRYYVFFPKGERNGIALHLPQGSFRYYWIDPISGAIVDRGEGMEGEYQSNIPGTTHPEARMLVLESEDAPDSFASW